jgi:hypothetical protein
MRIIAFASLETEKILKSEYCIQEMTNSVHLNNVENIFSIPAKVVNNSERARLK